MSNYRDNDGFSGAMAFIAVLAVFILVGAITLGGWAAGWWFREQNTNRESHLYEHEYGHQSSLIEDIGEKQNTFNDINSQLLRGDAAGNPAFEKQLKTQRLGVANLICKDAAQLNGDYDGLSQDQRKFVIKYCDGASVAADSTLRS